jgi:hypothetical protein
MKYEKKYNLKKGIVYIKKLLKSEKWQSAKRLENKESIGLSLIKQQVYEDILNKFMEKDK